MIVFFLLAVCGHLVIAQEPEIDFNAFLPTNQSFEPLDVFLIGDIAVPPTTDYSSVLYDQQLWPDGVVPIHIDPNLAAPQSEITSKHFCNVQGLFYVFRGKDSARHSGDH